MKEYEVVAKFLNSFAGAAHPQTFFEETTLENTDDFVRTKHGREFDKSQKIANEKGQIVYTFNNCTVIYIHEFTKL